MSTAMPTKAKPISLRHCQGFSDRAIFSLIFLLAVIAGSALWFFNRSKADSARGAVTTQSLANPYTYRSILVYPKAKQIEAFELRTLSSKDAAVQPFTNTNLQGGWTILAFGFTTCPDICPTTLTELKTALKPVTTKPRVVMVSVDPERDTDEVLREYVQYFDANFVGATADVAVLQKFAANLGALFEKETTGTGAMDYTMAHTATVYLINPDGHLAAMLRPGEQSLFDWPQIRQDLPAFLGQFNQQLDKAQP
jgi:protein SCO1